MNTALTAFLKSRLERGVFTGFPLTIFGALFLILLLTFLGITESIVNSLPIVKFDESFAQSLYHLRSPAAAQFLYTVTHAADQITIIVFAIFSVTYLYFKKELAYLYAILITCLGTEACVYVIKILINRPRPIADIAYYIENSASFPSGHASIAIAFYGFITYYIMTHVPGKGMKATALVLGVLLVVLIGFSRLYLGVHYLSDVLGGFLIGGLWLIIGIIVRERHFYSASIEKGQAI
ncbi:MAG: phosphoesterase [Parcubacteria group bacterium]|nr:phosphoesterase [Parcubacteria group bacterium]